MHNLSPCDNYAFAIFVFIEVILDSLPSLNLSTPAIVVPKGQLNWQVLLLKKEAPSLLNTWFFGGGIVYLSPVKHANELPCYQKKKKKNSLTLY